MKKFEQKEVEKELHRELKMRRKVWPTVTGTERFKDFEHQKRYDILEYLYTLISVSSVRNWVNFAQKAEEMKEHFEAQATLDFE